MTILMDHRDFELLGKEKNFDFDQIQKQVSGLKMVIVLLTFWSLRKCYKIVIKRLS